MVAAQEKADPFEESASTNEEYFSADYERMAQSFLDPFHFQKLTLDAFNGATGPFSEQLQSVAADQAAYVRDSFEEGVAALKQALAAPSLEEAAQIQSDYVQKAFQKNLEQVNKTMEAFFSASK